MKGALRWVIADFGPLILFWSMDLTFGLKPAIAGAVVFILTDGVWRYWRSLAFTRIYLLTSTLTVVFGGIDLMAATPFMLKYEAVITNLFIGGAFVAGARGPKPMVQELAEKQRGEPFEARPDITRFFRIFTLIWAGYFFTKAACYLAVAMTMPMTEAMMIRSFAGTASMGLMVAISFTQGPRLFRLFQHIGWLPSVAPREAQ